MLHLWDVQGDTIVTTEGVYARGYSLSGLDSEHMSESALRPLASDLYEIAKSEWPDETMLQFVLESRRESSEELARVCQDDAQSDPVLRHQQRRRTSFFEQLRPRRFSHSVFIAPLAGFRTRAFVRPSAHDHVAQRDCLLSRSEALKGAFDRIGLVPRSFGGPDLFNAYRQALGSAPEAPPATSNLYLGSPRSQDSGARTLRFRSVREAIVDVPIRWTPDAAKVGPTCFSVLSLNRLPETTRFTFAEAFLQLPFDFRLSAVVKVPKQHAARARVNALRRVQNASAHKNPYVENSEDTHVLSGMNQLSALLAASGQKLVLFGMQLVLFDEDLRALRSKVQSAREFLASYGLSFVEETGRHDTELMKSLPAMAVRFDRLLVIPSNNAVDLLPILGGPRGDRDPTVWLRTPRGELFGYDVAESKRENLNATVFGASGSGKSVFLNLLITTSMLTGHSAGRLLVVDFAGERLSAYRRLVELFGGRYVPVLSASGRERGSGLAALPPARDVLGPGGGVDGDTLSYLTVLFDALLLNTEQTKDAERFRLILRRALSQTYRGLEHSGRAPRFSDVLAALKALRKIEDIDLERLSVLIALLSGFIETEDRVLFEGDRTNSDERLLVLDLFGLDARPRRVQDAVALVLTQAVRDFAFDGDATTRKYVVLDEVAQLLRRPQIVGLVHELYSTSRKHGTGIWTVTQNYADYKRSAVADTILLNSTTQVLLSHAHAEAARKQIAEDFALNPRERVLFEGLRTEKGRYSEALLKTSTFSAEGDRRSQSTKVRIELSPFDYQVCTSDPADRAGQAAFMKAHPKLPLAVALDRLAYLGGRR